MEADYAVDERLRRLRVFHIANVPNEPFFVNVGTIWDAIQILKALASYDLYLGEDVVFSNVQGLQVFDGGEWADWEDGKGRDIYELMDSQA